MSKTLVSEVFSVVDSGDAAAFSRLFADNGRIRFGNGEPMVGRESIEQGVGGSSKRSRGCITPLRTRGSPVTTTSQNCRSRMTLLTAPR